MLKSSALLDRRIAGQALKVAFRKLDPRTLVRNPVMFVVEVVAVLATVVFVIDLFRAPDPSDAEQTPSGRRRSRG